MHPPDASAPKDESTIGAFGQTITWPDGLAVTVSEPQAYQPSSAAATSRAPARYVSLTVTLTNESAKNVEAAGTTMAVTANGTAADQVFDTAKGIGGSPTSTVLPGKSITYTVAFGLPTTARADLQVEVRPSFGIGYQPAIFTGQA